MVFGLFGGGKELEQQKTALRECAESLAALEESIAGLTRVKSTFAEVWPESDIQQFCAKTGKFRQLVDLLAYRAASAKRELSNFDSSIELMRSQLPLLHRDWMALKGLMVARGSIASGELSIELRSDPPSVFDCQRALVALAEGLRDEIRVHIDELTAIKSTSIDSVARRTRPREI